MSKIKFIFLFCALVLSVPNLNVSAKTKTFRVQQQLTGPNVTTSQDLERRFREESLKAIADKEQADYTLFLQNIQSRVQEAWDPPTAGEVDFTFRVSAASGQLIPESIVIKSASSKQIEDATIEAIYKAAQNFHPVVLSGNRKDEVDIHLNLKSD
jgi:hypothetical protein